MRNLDRSILNVAQYTVGLWDFTYIFSLFAETWTISAIEMAALFLMRTVFCVILIVTSYGLQLTIFLERAGRP